MWYVLSLDFFACCKWHFHLCKFAQPLFPVRSRSIIPDVLLMVIDNDESGWGLNISGVGKVKEMCYYEINQWLISMNDTLVFLVLGELLIVWTCNENKLPYLCICRYYPWYLSVLRQLEHSLISFLYKLKMCLILCLCCTVPSWNDSVKPLKPQLGLWTAALEQFFLPGSHLQGSRALPLSNTHLARTILLPVQKAVPFVQITKIQRERERVKGEEWEKRLPLNSRSKQSERLVWVVALTSGVYFSFKVRERDKKKHTLSCLWPN